MPSRAPSAAAPTSTTIAWNVSGTGVNGSGTLICADVAVSTVTNATAAVRSAMRCARESACTVIAVRNVECMSRHLNVCVPR